MRKLSHCTKFDVLFTYMQQYQRENHYEIPRFSPRSGGMMKSSPVNKSTEGSPKNHPLTGSLISAGDRKLKYSIAGKFLIQVHGMHNHMLDN